MSKNDFDSIAGIYDGVARLVFGKSIGESQVVFLSMIKPQSTVLVLGGGTGWALQELIKARPSVEVVYVEKSRKMLDAAKSRMAKWNTSNVRWVNSSIEEWENTVQYDIITCYFFLDVFESGKLEQVIVPKLVKWLKPNGHILVADFQRSNVISQKILLSAMHLFFRLTCRLESRALSDLHGTLKSVGFTAIKEVYFFKQLIFSRVYKVER